MAAIGRGIARQHGQIGHRRMRADEEIRQRGVAQPAAAPVLPKGPGGQRGARPRQGAALRFIHIEQGIKRVHCGLGHQQFGVDHQVDVQRCALAARLELINSPGVPGAGRVHGIDPDVGIDQEARAAVVGGQAMAGHEVAARQGRRDARTPSHLRHPFA